MKKYFLFSSFLILVTLNSLFADEGMWIPLLVGKYNIEDMQKKGFRLTADDIYSINHASLKDAVPIFGRGCTGAVISDKGLLITNHHCGFPQIQYHSNITHDYLTNGFWAASAKEELPCPNLTVTFLIRMEDVTQLMNSMLPVEVKEQERYAYIKFFSDSIAHMAIKGTHYQAEVKSLFGGNEFYLYVTEVFKDIRLVGAPPSGIGKFGGDTDNWMWPRHTGDFSLFRIYADNDNNPANYSPDNVPYKPKKHLDISLKGIKEGDFTMVLGYPGKTNEFAPSYALRMIALTEDPAKVEIRAGKMEVLRSFMSTNPVVRIKYASKYAGISNYWKKWDGERKGLLASHAIENKVLQEKDFQQWVEGDTLRIVRYGDILGQYSSIYKKMSLYTLAEALNYEGIYTQEIISLASKLKSLAEIKPQISSSDLSSLINNTQKSLRAFYKDYDVQTDKAVFIRTLSLYNGSISYNFVPEELKKRNLKSVDGCKKYAALLYNQSLVSDSFRIFRLLDHFKVKDCRKIKKDPAYCLYKSVYELFNARLYPEMDSLNILLENINRRYIQAQREMNPGKLFYPDANFTLRVAYGNVRGYQMRDAVNYRWYTTLSGMLQKEDSTIADYRVLPEIKKIYQSKDFGIYGENGDIRTCFISTNHTTGGNSGSPVLNADGQLIGLNFDRNWEGTMSDLSYDIDRCRNISLDIKYALFIIDKYAGAGYLLNEMTLVH
jgi:hypothetical protein